MSRAAMGATVRPASVVRNTSRWPARTAAMAATVVPWCSWPTVTPPACSTIVSCRIVSPAAAPWVWATKDGSKGEDLILPVPCGTVVFEARGEQGKAKHPGAQLADLRHAGDKFVVAAGGAGGLGNIALANKTRRAPASPCSANSVKNVT